MEKVILYAIEGCPFCQKVQDYMDANNIEYERVVVASDRADAKRQEIAEKSGVATTPVIQVGEKYIGESDDIIKYLEEHKGQ